MIASRLSGTLKSRYLTARDLTTLHLPKFTKSRERWNSEKIRAYSNLKSSKISSLTFY